MVLAVLLTASWKITLRYISTSVPSSAKLSPAAAQFNSAFGVSITRQQELHASTSRDISQKL